jgi:PIN domain nuclease of toxin-antitoxin system
VRILVDTQCWLWMVSDPDRLSRQARRRILDIENERVLSAASGWEIAIKYSIGKLELPEPPEAFVPSRMALTLTTPLAVQIHHALQASRLPSHHRDPFDRLLIAQAQAEKLPILTSDRQFKLYDVEVIPA